MRARVLVKPKAGIGRLIELDVEDPGRLPEMCQRLLTNPLIEDYEIVEDAGS